MEVENRSILVYYITVYYSLVDDEDTENLTEELILNDYNASWFLYNSEKVYRNIYAETYDKDDYYDILIYYPHVKNKDSVKKIKILNKHLLMHVGERVYRYGVVVEDGEKEYIMPGFTCIIYLPLPKDIKDILRWGVKNGTIHVEINKSI